MAARRSNGVTTLFPGEPVLTGYTGVDVRHHTRVENLGPPRDGSPNKPPWRLQVTYIKCAQLASLEKLLRGVVVLGARLVTKRSWVQISARARRKKFP